MGNMIVSDNRIKSRRYNLVIDGEIVEEFLSSRTANEFADAYREEGFAVDKIEVFSVTNSNEIVGDNVIVNKPQIFPRKALLTPAATDAKIQRDRNKMAARNAGILSRKNKNAGGIRYTGYGEDRNSSLREMYLDNLRRKGYRVHNQNTGEIWIGLQKEIAERIFNFCKSGGKKSDLNIKFLGAK